jgi:hypothetical protein
VNLATYLLRDAFRGEFECGVVVSNDSDLLGPIKIVRGELGLPVGLLNPHERPSAVLRKEATFLKQIRPGLLAKCQFPDPITTPSGEIRKPPSW